MRKGPLAGLKVVEMVGVGPGPFAAMWMADMGAEIIRVDRPGQRYNQTRGDLLNRGRRSLAVDLKKAGAAEVVLRLVAQADVLIEGFRPGVMERLGLGPDAAMALNPRLIYSRITGWGQDGPLAQRAGHDLNYLAVTGILATLGPEDRPPPPPLNLVGDFGGGGMLLLSGILAALVERGVSGKGQVVDAAMFEGASLLASMIWGYHHKGHWKAERNANIFDGGAPFYRTYRCADGKFVALAAIEPEFWNIFLDRAGIDDEELRTRQKERDCWPELASKLEAIFLTRSRDEWCSLLEYVDACVSPVLQFGEAAQHPHNAARSALAEHNSLSQPAVAPKFLRTPGEAGGPPPYVGEQTRDILIDWAFAPEETDALLKAGVVWQGSAA